MNVPRRWRRFVAGLAVAVLASAGPARAAGPSQGNAPPSTPPGKSKPPPFTPPGHQSSPPGDSPLPSPTVIGAATGGATPFGWIDDASVLPAGTGVLMVSAVTWRGTDATELDVPVVGAAVGVAPRFQLAATVPNVMGSDANGIAGGLGTTFVTAKFGVIQGSAFKLSVAPTLEVLGAGVVQFLEPTESRVQWGLPVSVEVDGGGARAFASAGYFSRGIRFAGGGLGVDLSPHVSISGTFSHAWLSDASFAAAAGATSVRNEISGTLALTATSHVGVFGSIGHSFATSDPNGAGMTLGGGIWIMGAPAAPRK